MLRLIVPKPLWRQHPLASRDRLCFPNLSSVIPRRLLLKVRFQCSFHLSWRQMPGSNGMRARRTSIAGLRGQLCWRSGQLVHSLGNIRMHLTDTVIGLRAGITSRQSWTVHTTGCYEFVLLMDEVVYHIKLHCMIFIYMDCCNIDIQLCNYDRSR